ncbi:MAG: helix-turn-helix transcriptional regulator [Candidatus Nanopelagicales bacterium]
MEDPADPRLSGLADPTPAGRARVAVLQALRAQSLSVPQLATALGLHENTVRFHLARLIEGGLVAVIAGAVDAAARAGRGRPPLRYRATEQARDEGARSYRLLAALLLRRLGKGRAAKRQAYEAGVEWGSAIDVPGRRRAHAQVQTLVEVLAAIGFEPDSEHADAGEIALHHCPFLELVESDARLVCTIHHGLLTGVAQRAGGGVQVIALEPFVQPDLCRVSYRLAGASRTA